MSDTYECDHCHGIFESGRSTEEAEAECQELWGINHASQRPSDVAIICDDCFKELTADEPPSMEWADQ